MQFEGEIRLALIFSAILAVISVLLTVLWWSENRDNRTVRWLFASCLALVVFCTVGLMAPLTGGVLAISIGSASAYLVLALGYICLLRTVDGQARTASVLAWGVVIAVSGVLYAILSRGSLYQHAALESVLIAPALVLMASSLMTEVTVRYRRSLAIVLASPFIATAIVLAVRLPVVLVWPGSEQAILMNGIVMLALGVNAVAFLFCLAHLTNNQDASALESARRDAQAASDSKSAFLRTMSHELRTPLNAIIGFSDLIRHECSDKNIDRARNNAHHIHTAGVYLLEMIEDLLALSAISADKTRLHEEVFMPDEMIDEVVHLLSGRAEQGGVTIIVRHRVAPVAIRADLRRLIQAIVNLAHNAVKFTRRGGRIEIGLDRSDGGGLEIFVRDSGIGMSTAELRNALMLFGQNRNPVGFLDGSTGARTGIGIGLPLARDLLRAHGGDLKLESRPGQGTLARASLPEERICRSTPIPTRIKEAS